MIDIEIHGTGGRTAESHAALMAQTRKALSDTSYSDQLTFVDAGSSAHNIKVVQTMPFARVYAPPDVLPGVIDDIRRRLRDLFETLEGVQVIRVNTREQ